MILWPSGWIIDCFSFFMLRIHTDIAIPHFFAIPVVEEKRRTAMAMLAGGAVSPGATYSISSPSLNVGLVTPPDESIPSSPFSDHKSEESFWNRLNKRAKSLHNNTDSQHEDSDTKVLPEDSKLLHKGLEAVASSLTRITHTLGVALEDGANLAETKLSELFPVDPPATSPVSTLKRRRVPENAEENLSEQGKDELKASVKKEDNAKLKDHQNLAMAMASKAKFLERDLKSIRGDLCFMRERCAFLEEENRRLRDAVTKGVRPEEDDLVRLQLEALLAEKGRLAHENANYARENQYLHQVVEYHKLTLLDMDMDMAAAFGDVSMRLDFSSSASPSPYSSPMKKRSLLSQNDDDDANGDPHSPIHSKIFQFSSPLQCPSDDDTPAAAEDHTLS